MLIAPLRVRLPQLDHRIAGRGLAFAIDDPEYQSDVFALRVVGGHDTESVIRRQDKVEERSDGLRSAGNQRHTLRSSNGVADRPRSTMSKRYPMAHSGSVSDRSKDDTSR